MRIPYISTNRQGFTLVEMAIVIIIIGLLVGGVLAGKSMIRSSKLRTINVDISAFNSAISTFKTKYNALPGDFKTATTNWGTASGGCPAGARTGTQTCNGDGNDRINLGATRETYLVWQHLSNEGLISGKFTGVEGAGGSAHHVPGTNSPLSGYNNGGFAIFPLSDAWGTYSAEVPASVTREKIAHLLLFGGRTTTTLPHAPILQPDEAQAIDAKSDDGYPGTGNIFSVVPTSALLPGCTVAGAPDSYNVSVISPLCALFFVGQF